VLGVGKRTGCGTAVSCSVQINLVQFELVLLLLLFKSNMADTVDAKRVREYNEEDTPDFEEKLDKLAAMVKASKYTVFYTGAGISTSAGVGKRL